MSTPQFPDPNNQDGSPYGQQPYGAQQPSPQQPYGAQQPNPQQGYGIPQQPGFAAPQQPQKKKGGCMKWGLIILGIIVVIGIISAIAGGGDSNDSSSNSGSQGSESANNASDNGKEKEAPAKDESTEFALGETYTTKDGLEITINNTQPATDVFGDTYLGAEVTYVNNSDKEKDFNPFDWSVQTPAGVVSDYAINGFDDQLDSGKLTPGGTVTGSLYFEGADPGEYRLIWKPTFSFSSDTATWVSTI